MTDRNQQCIRIVQDRVAKWSEAEPWDETQLLNAHPELEPELRQELDRIRPLIEARRRALENTDDIQDERATTPGGVIPGEPPEIADYRVLRPIGRGGFGEVWMAQHRLLNDLVAVKFVSKANPVELDGLRACHDRARQLPGLVPVRHVGQTENHYYCVMPLADNIRSSMTVSIDQYEAATLAWHVENRPPLPPEELVPIARELLAALAGLHDAGLTHWDVKPANVLRLGGKWQLADVGLVTKNDEFAGSRGTRAFWPPEGPRDLTADLFALGRTLYLLATGLELDEFDPYVAGEFPVAESSPWHQGLRGFFARACHGDPAPRFQAAGEMLEAVEQIPHPPAPAPPPPPKTPAAPAPARQRIKPREESRERPAENARTRDGSDTKRSFPVAVRLAVAGLVTVLGVIIIIKFKDGSWLSIESDKDLAGIEIKDGTGGEKPSEKGAAGKTDRTRPGNPAPDGQSQNLIPASGQFRVTTGHAGRINALAADPDSGWAATAGRDGVIRIWQPEGEQARLALALVGHVGEVTSLAWHRHTSELLSLGDGRLIRWKITRDESTERLSAARVGTIAIDATYAAISPDGKWLALSSRNHGTVEIRDSANYGEGIRLEQLERGVVGISWSPDSTRLVIAGDEDALLTWNFETGDVNRTGDAKDVTAVRWSPEPGRLLATTAHSSGEIQLWQSDDLTSDRVLKQNAGGAGGPGTDLYWIDKETLAQASGSYLHFWDLESGETIQEPFHLPDLASPRVVLAFHSDQTDAQRGAFGCEDGRLFGWKRVDGRFRQELLAPPAGHAVVPPAISPDGKRLAVAGPTGVSVVNVDAERAERALPVDPPSAVSSLAWSCDSNRLAIGTTDHWLQVFDTESGEMNELPGIAGAGSLVWSPNDSMLAAGSLRLFSSGGTLRPTRVWGFQEPGPLSSSLFDQLGPTAIGSWAPQGDLLALATGTTITVCDTAGRPVLSHEFESRPIQMAWMKKPGAHELLAVAFSDGPVQV
nr:PD40 domain-containing protein [Planctomycetota bacterium]